MLDWGKLLEALKHYLRPTVAVAIFITLVAVLLVPAWFGFGEDFLESNRPWVAVPAFFLGIYLLAVTVEALRPYAEKRLKADPATVRSERVRKELEALPDRERGVVLAFAMLAHNGLEIPDGPTVKALVSRRILIHIRRYSDGCYLLRDEYWDWLMINRERFIESHKHVAEEHRDLLGKISKWE